MSTEMLINDHQMHLNSLIDNHSPAHVIRTDAEAIKVAESVAAELGPGAAMRDRSKTAPFAGIDKFSASGLWAITVPKEYGGPELSIATLCQVFEIISQADPSIGQIPQNHFTTVDDIRLEGTEAQKRFFFNRILLGDRIGSAFSEAKGKHVLDIQTELTQADHGQYLVNGEKFYCTGAKFAHWLPVLAKDSKGRDMIAIANRRAPGITVIDDWSSFGQRTTASGTVKLSNVVVTEDQLIPTYRSYSRPTNSGAFAQIMHAAIDAGMARGAIQETIDFVIENSRPWVDANVDRASDDPLTVTEIGNLEYRLHAAEALLERAAYVLEDSFRDMTERNCAAASIAVAEAKIATTEIAVLSANKLFELSGTKSTLEKYDLDRHWRDARTHTLHDPVRWKYHAVGNYYLNGKNPNRHNWI
jgi:SfnB family sulfur acquisition oxidoreductase